MFRKFKIELMSYTQNTNPFSSKKQSYYFAHPVQGSINSHPHLIYKKGMGTLEKKKSNRNQERR